jgi:hypothetical protein
LVDSRVSGVKIGRPGWFWPRFRFSRESQKFTWLKFWLSSGCPGKIGWDFGWPGRNWLRFWLESGCPGEIAGKFGWDFGWPGKLVRILTGIWLGSGWPGENLAGIWLARGKFGWDLAGPGKIWLGSGWPGENLAGIWLARQNLAGIWLPGKFGFFLENLNFGQNHPERPIFTSKTLELTD